MSKRHSLGRAPRLPLNARVRLSWQDDKGMLRVDQGRCIDISERGLGVTLADAIPLRSYVQFRIDEINFEGSGSVRYVGRKGLKQYVGLEFSGSLRWPPAAAKTKSASTTG